MHSSKRQFSVSFVALILILASGLSGVAPISTARAADKYQTALMRWRAADGDFAGWRTDGVLLLKNGRLRLDPNSAQPGTDPFAPGTFLGGNFYNGGSFRVGEAESPVMEAPFEFVEAIPSWNAETPAGTWLEARLRVQIDGHWSKWYILGIWASDESTISRHSVDEQGDADGDIYTDTFSAEDDPATAYQLKLRLFSADGVATPTVRNAAVALSTAPRAPESPRPGASRSRNRVLDLPQCSQMVYPDGGEIWCSPTATSMVLSYWQGYAGPCEPQVRSAVDGVYDWIYDGHGNWPFNAGYAATKGFEAYVARFTSLAEAGQWIEAGVPVVMSYPWKEGELDGAPLPSSNGHLAVLVGFDASGNPIVNDPAGATDAEVRRVYRRDQLERNWLEGSGGTVYLIYPAGLRVPGF